VAAAAAPSTASITGRSTGTAVPAASTASGTQARGWIGAA
jgi:hypothetical protein